MSINVSIETLWIITVLCGLMAIALLSGKGAWIIAGYNVATKKEKEKYDEKKLCRVMGGCLSFITILFIVTCLVWKIVPDYWGTILFVLILLDVAVTLVLSETICRR